MPNISHENHLIFMRMTVKVTYILIPIVSLKDSFCHRGKSKLGIGLFIHELLREPLNYIYVPFYSTFIKNTFNAFNIQTKKTNHAAFVATI